MRGSATSHGKGARTQRGAKNWDHKCNQPTTFIIFFLTFYLYLSFPWASLVAQMVKNLPAIQESQVWSSGWEDHLEKASILAWEIPWTGEPGGLQTMELKIVKSRRDWVTNTFSFPSPKEAICFLWIITFNKFYVISFHHLIPSSDHYYYFFAEVHLPWMINSLGLYKPEHFYFAFTEEG